MTYYIEAYDADHKEILGNLDGQAVLRVKDFKRASLYKRVERGLIRAPRVQYWKVVDAQGNLRAKLFNPHFEDRP